jgi:uncharacterized membrane-anchored protein
MTLRELLAAVAPDKLAETERLSEALHDGDGNEAPLFVQLFSAIGTWIGAAMIATIFAALEIHRIVPLALVLAVALFVGAVWLSRRGGRGGRTGGGGRSLVLTQLIWAMALGGHGLIWGALAELQVDEVWVALTWTVLNIALLFLVRVPSFAIASAVCAVGFATWLSDSLELPMYPLWAALPAAAVATAAWVAESRVVASIGRNWSALAYGLPIGVAGSLSLFGIDDASGMTMSSTGATIATLVLCSLIGVVLWQASREQDGRIEARTLAIAIVAALAVVAARHVPGVSLALLWLLLAHLRKSVALQTIALIQLVGFLAFFYYQIQTTLLLKSLWVLSTGAVLLLGARLLRPQALDVVAGEGAHGKPKLARRPRMLPALVLVVLTVGLVLGPSIHKQRILASGQTVLLPLAPVDPRSLMQGDYMQLRYELELEVEQAFGHPFHELHDRGDIPRHGELVIEVDDESVGHFVRIDDGTPLQERERLLEYRLREDWGQNLRVGADTFLFEEGSAALYQNARFGELVVSDDGEAILVGLRDADKQPLGHRMHDY